MLKPECSEHRALTAQAAEPMETLMARPSERPDGSGKTGSDELARVVRERRESLGWTRQQLADATGIPYPTIAQIETAYRGVSPSRLGVIARVLGLDPKELYDVLASQGEVAGAGPAVRGPGAGEERATFPRRRVVARQPGVRGPRPCVTGRTTAPGPSRPPPTRWPRFPRRQGPLTSSRRTSSVRWSSCCRSCRPTSASRRSAGFRTSSWTRSCRSGSRVPTARRDERGVHGRW